MLRAVRGIRGVLGAGRECRYSGARRGIGGLRGHWGPIGVLEAIRGVGGVKVYGWTDRECRYSGTRRGTGSIRGHWVF